MGEAKFMVMKRRSRVRLMGASAIVLVGTVSTAANARCTTVGSAVTCDTSAPNPERNGTFGTQITLLPGTIVQVDDPFAGASPRDYTVFVASGGNLTTASGSQILNNYGQAVLTGSNVRVDNSGTISSTSTTGVLLGSGSQITVNQGGVVQTTGLGSSGSFSIAPAIGAAGGGTQIIVDGTVRTNGDNTVAIAPASAGLFGLSYYGSSISIGSTGNVATTGASSPAISIGDGSSLSVAGQVSASGSGSSAIALRGATTVSIAVGATVQSTQAPAIVGTTGATALTIAGTVNGSVGGAAIALGSGDDILTIAPTAVIGGSIDGGAGTDTINLVGPGVGTLGTTTNIERVSVQDGNWTLGSGFRTASLSYSGSGAIVQQGTIEGSGNVLSSDYQTSMSFTNAGTIRSLSGSTGFPAVFINAGSFGNSGTISAAADGVGFSSEGGFTNTGTITAAGTAFSLFGPSFVNDGTIRSTGGVGAAITGSSGPIYNRINNGTIEGATIGVYLSANMINTGTITSPGLAIRLDSYGQIENRAGGVITGGAAAITPGNGAFAYIFNAVVNNFGTINGDVSLASTYSTTYGTSNIFYAQPGGILNGNLALGFGDYLVADLAGSANGRFAGITGSVTADRSYLRYRVRSDAAATIVPITGFQAVGYEVVGGATLTLTAGAPSTAPLTLAGVGTVDINADIRTVNQAALQSTAVMADLAATVPSTTLSIINRGSLATTHTDPNSFPGATVNLSTGDTLRNIGTISATEEANGAFVSISAVSGGTAVSNEGSISIGGTTGSVIGVRYSKAVVNTGSIVQAAGSTIDAIGVQDVASFTNSGTIRVGGAAIVAPALSEPAIITNAVDGVISGGGVAISSLGALSLTNAGTISANGGTRPIAIQETGSSAVSIVNSGTITGGIQLGSAADSIDNSGTISGDVALGDGDDRFTLRAGSSVIGLIDGGAGSDALALAGTGVGTLGATANFETLTVQSGTWTLASASTYIDGITIAAGATLVASAATATGAITDNGTLRFDQATDASTSAVISGSGILSKAGNGTLTLGSLTGFSGSFDVAAGRLASTGGVTIAAGRTLGGNGTLTASTVTIASGGRIAPGASIGTLTIDGNFVQQAGSVYAAEIGAATSDRLVVTGSATLQPGAQLALTGAPGIGTRYTLLTAAGGVSGTYAVTQPASSLTELRIGYSANAVTADVVRSRLGLLSVAQTGNQVSAASGLGAVGTANAAYGALVAQPNDNVVRAGLNTLSGEIHSSMRAAMVRDASLVRNTVLDHAADGEDGPTLWAAGLASWGHDDGTPYGRGAAKTRRDTRGGLIGLGLSFGDIRLGIAGGYSRTKLMVDERASDARLKTVHVLGYATGQFGALRLRGTAGYSRVDGRTDRRVGIGSFSDRLRADADGNVLQGSAEAAMPFAVAAGEIAPIVGFEGYRARSDAFAEAGGAAALRAGKRVQSSAFSRAGLQVRTPLVGSVSAIANVAWVHRLAGEDPTTVVSFGGTGGFRVSGAPLSRNAADAALGISWAASERFSLSASYRGTIGDKSDDSSVRVAASLRL